MYSRKRVGEQQANESVLLIVCRMIMTFMMGRHKNKKGVSEMLNSTAFANAITAVTIAVYVVCRVLSLVAPKFLFRVGASWFHTFDLSVVESTTPMNFGTFIFGAVTLAALTWATTYFAIELYNRFAKK